MKIKFSFFALVTLIAGVVYKTTLGPTVEYIDSGELALACKFLGIAHPTGYPLYTLLGRISTYFWGPLILQVNFMSLLFTASAAGFLYLVISEYFREAQTNFTKELIASSLSLFAAFTPIWWGQGTTNEVYSLNLLLMTVSIWALIKGINSGNLRWILFSLYALGLCLANHLSAIYLIPGYLFLLLIEFKRQRFSVSSYIWMALNFVFPISLYLFLPVRAAFKPFLNWGGVNDIYFLFKHISGWQYRIWMFDKPLEIFDFSGKILPAAKLILAQFGWIGMGLLFVGIAATAIYNRKALLFIAVTGLLNLIYVLNYEIGDIESYYLPLILISTLLIAFGCKFLIKKLSDIGNWKLLTAVLCVLVVLLPLINLVANYGDADRSRREFARRGVEDIALSMPDGGVGLIENWDFYSPWLYLHFEEGYRPDVVLLDKELMRRSWYIDFIKRQHSDIFRRSRAEIEEFLRQVAPFERGQKFRPDIIDNAYYGMLNAIIKNEAKQRPIYTNIINDPRIVSGMALAPCGILYRFVTSNEYLEYLRFEFQESLWGNPSIFRDKRVGYMLSFYARAFDSRYKYARFYQHSEEADYYSELASRAGRIERDLNRIGH